MSENCIFCKIVDNQLPSFTICENNQFKVIFDRFPWTTGHTLILLKRHAETIFDLTESESEKIFGLATIIAKVLKESLNPDGLNILQNNGEAANQSVGHFHMHLIPRYKDDGVSITFPENYPSQEELEKILEAVKNKMP